MDKIPEVKLHKQIAGTYGSATLCHDISAFISDHLSLKYEQLLRNITSSPMQYSENSLYNKCRGMY